MVENMKSVEAKSVDKKWPVFNPFIRHPTSTLGKVKIVLVGSVLVPIRLTGTIITLTLCLLWCNLGSMGCDTGVPYSPLRRKLLLGGVRVSARILLFFYGYLWIHETHEVEDRKERAKQPRPAVVLCNHIGFAELLYFVSSEGCCFVSKKPNRELPFIGKITEVIQSIFVDRGETDQVADADNNNTDRNSKYRPASNANSTTASILERATAPPGTWPPLALCPEGTTTNGHIIIDFRTGAFRAGLPVKPVVLSMPFSPVHGFDPHFTCQHIATNILGLMTQPMNHLHVTHLPVYIPNDAEKADARLYANNVRSQMAASLGVKTYPLSWLDKLPFEPTIRAKEMGKALQMERNKGVPPLPPVFTEDTFGNPIESAKDK